MNYIYKILKQVKRMRTLVVIGCCLLVCIVKAVPAPGRGALKGYCITNQDCNKRECCVSFATPRGKRAADRLSTYLRRFVKGKCEKRGKLGTKCLIRDFSSSVTDIFYHSCPCSIGYACEGTGQPFPPLGELGTCVKGCSSSSDCGPFECCVRNSILRGKRSASRVKRGASGHCEPMGKRGSECLVNNGSGKSNRMFFRSCPCTNLLSCVGKGRSEVPLGEIGRCGLKGYGLENKE